METMPLFETEAEQKAWLKGYDSGLKDMRIWRRLAKGAALAIQAVSEEWFADALGPKLDKLMHRIMGWEFKIKKELGEIKT